MTPYGPSVPFLAPKDRSVETRAQIDVLTDELASGRRADLGRAVASDFSAVSRLAHDLRTHQALGSALTRAGTWLEIAQQSLGSVAATGDAMRDQLTATFSATGPASIGGLAPIARNALTDMATVLSASFGGRPIFANGDPSAAPPLDVDVILSETAALAAGAVDLDAYLAAFDAYFDPPAGGGIEANAIRAYAADDVRFPLGGGSSISVPVSLADRGVRDALKQAALVAALPSAGFPLTETDRARLSLELPARSSAASDGLTGTRSRIGGLEERVGRLASEHDDRRTALERRRAEAAETDPFETATRLQNEMTRLESIFAVTARRARLRLTDFIR